MSGLTIFDDVTRTRSKAGGAREPAFDVYNTSALPKVSNVRAVMEAWFQRYPLEHQPELRARFRASAPHSFDAAFFELYLHELLLRTGHAIECHPALNGMTRRPDFRATTQEGESMYVEAVVVREQSVSDLGAERRKAELYDAIDEIPSPFYFLHIRERGTPETAVPRGDWKGRVQAFVQTLPSETQGLPSDLDDDALPSINLHHDGWDVTITAWPRQNSYGNAKARTMGLRIGAMWRAMNSGATLREAIESKSTRYGEFLCPYIIAANLVADFVDHDDVMDALFGREVIIEGASGTRLGRDPNGAWMARSGATNTRVSAILVGAAFPSSAAERTHTLYHNPWAQHSALGCLPQLPHRVPREGRLELRPGTITAAALFDLPDGWPFRSNPE